MGPYVIALEMGSAMDKLWSDQRGVPDANQAWRVFGPVQRRQIILPQAFVGYVTSGKVNTATAQSSGIVVTDLWVDDFITMIKRVGRFGTATQLWNGTVWPGGLRGTERHGHSGMA
jgi:hypothetical protein